ncbi:MAG: UbiX family flavin prenyltransferase [Gammaproteobacteria bacterium]|nr:UbiX family flavin prenyltransferase [Gammaproteobacteria bacterium]
MSNKQRMIVGISGATGIVYATKLLEILRQLDIESHLVVTKTGEMTRAYETDLSKQQLQSMADRVYNVNDLAAPIASGSFKTMGMIVVPCSIRSLGEIATGVTSNLLTRAADVVLKERRRLVLLVRESPLHAGHLKSMLAVTEMGGIIAPPVPAFYMLPKTLDDIVLQTVGRTLDLFNLDAGIPRWGDDAV